MNGDSTQERERSNPPATMPRRALELADRIGAWVDAGAEPVRALACQGGDAARDDRFEALALEVFALQFEYVEPYRRLCLARGATPDTIERWQDVPAVPVLAFKSLDLAIGPAAEVFRSSGTTGATRSVHRQPFPDLYRRVIDASFPAFCLAGLEPEGLAEPAMLALVPSREQARDSSLGFMVDHILFGDGLRRGVAHRSDRIHGLGESGVDFEKAGAWLDRRRGEGRPALVLATSFALVQWCEALAAEGGAGGGLPAGSVVFDTGGFKGRTRELSRLELEDLVARHLGVPPERMVREYGMTELTSQLYTRRLHGGDGEHFVAPPWLRYRVVDPTTLEEVPRGERGVVALFDLGNVGSAAHLLTQDAGRDTDLGLRLEGRATGAELRGCSLTLEELSTRG